MALTNNKNVLAWVDEMVALTKPDKVVWIDAAKSAVGTVCPFWEALCNRFTTAVFKPEKLKS